MLGENEHNNGVHSFYNIYKALCYFDEPAQSH